MRRAIAIALGLVVGAFVAVGLLAVAGYTAPEPSPYGAPIGPRMAPDTGAGEMLIAVLGGVYASAADAEAANAGMRFGDLAGYYAVPMAQFHGLEEQVGAPGDFALVSVFRTDEGAREFVSLAQTLGYPSTVLPDRVLSLGGLYAGLGQEENPNGSGPLSDPIPASLP